MAFFLAYSADAAHRFLGMNNNRRGRRSSDRVVEQHLSYSHDTATPVESMDSLVKGLRENHLRTLKVGWNDSDFIHSDKSISTLEKAWHRNHSVTNVNIGYKIGMSTNYKAVEGTNDRNPGVPIHTRNRRLLCHTLDRLLAQKSPHILLSLTLVLDDWVPEHLLNAVLKQQPHLQTIVLHGVTCRRVSRPGNSDSLRSDTTNSTAATSTSQDSSSSCAMRSPQYAGLPAHKRFIKSKKKRRGVANIGMHSHLQQEQQQQLQLQQHRAARMRSEHVDICSVVLPYVGRVKSQIKSLKLIDCGLCDEDISYLVDAIQGKYLASLSVRSNRQLSGKGVMDLCACASAVTDDLDLSLCDFSPFDGQAIAAGLAQRRNALGKVHLRGNYRLDAIGLVALVKPGVLQKVKSLDLSYCELGESRTARVLEQLKVSQIPGSALHEIQLQGCTVSSAKSQRALQQLLSSPNSRLRRLILNDPVESGKYWSTNLLQHIADIMPHNYDVEELKIDFMNTTPNVKIWDDDIKPWLELNLLGRRSVLPDRAVSNSEWLQVIQNAGGKDLDTLYWFVRQSTERISQK